MSIFKRKPLISEIKQSSFDKFIQPMTQPSKKFFNFCNPDFWIVILLLLILGSIWLTFIRLIDWLHAIATH